MWIGKEEKKNRRSRNVRTSGYYKNIIMKFIVFERSVDVIYCVRTNILYINI